MKKNVIILEVLAVPRRAARARPPPGGSTGARAKAWCFLIHAEATLSHSLNGDWLFYCTSTSGLRGYHDSKCKQHGHTPGDPRNRYQKSVKKGPFCKTGVRSAEASISRVTDAHHITVHALGGANKRQLTPPNMLR